MLFLMRTTLVCEMRLFPMTTLWVLKPWSCSSLPPNRPGLEAQRVPTATWPLCHHLLSTSHSVYMEVMLLRHEDILCHAIMKTLQP